VCVCVCLCVCVCVVFVLVGHALSQWPAHKSEGCRCKITDTTSQQRQEQQKSVANHNKCLDVLHWSLVLQVHTTLLTGGSSGGGGGGYGMGGGGFGGGGFGGARGPPRDVDWLCPDCGSNVFASRSEVSVLHYLFFLTDSCVSVCLPACLHSCLFCLSPHLASSCSGPARTRSDNCYYFVSLKAIGLLRCPGLVSQTL